MRTEKNAYAPGDSVVVIASIDNDSDVHIPNLQLRLVASLEMSSDSGRGRFLREVVQKTQYPGIDPKSVVKDVRMQLALPLRIQQRSLGYIIRYFKLSYIF
jgi:hypothetical protein